MSVECKVGDEKNDTKLYHSYEELIGDYPHGTSNYNVPLIDIEGKIMVLLDGYGGTPIYLGLDNWKRVVTLNGSSEGSFPAWPLRRYNETISFIFSPE